MPRFLEDQVPAILRHYFLRLIINKDLAIRKAQKKLPQAWDEGKKGSCSTQLNLFPPPPPRLCFKEAEGIPTFPCKDSFSHVSYL